MTAAVVRADARDLPLPDACVDLVVTSPPYFGLRSYTDGGAHYAGQIGSEATPAEWLANLVECTREWVRVLKPSGSIFVNLGDKYNSAGSNQQSSLKNGAAHAAALLEGRVTGGRGKTVAGAREKSLLGLPWRYALACTDELGLILRRDIIWSKPNGLPESVTDRCRSSHEYVFHLVKQPRYYAAVDEIREPTGDYNGKTWADRRAIPGSNPGGHAFGHSAGVAAAATVFAPNPLGKLPGSVWSIPSQPLVVPAHLGVDHFAAFPLELPRRIIAGWSPPGVCTACGEGRRPVSEREIGPDAQGRVGTLHGGDRAKFGHATERKMLDGLSLRTITGYACACWPPPFVLDDDDLPLAPPTTPAIVLDPFAGTGTTMLAASALGRVGIGCDLSMDYARLARWRTQDRAEIAKAMQVPKPPVQADGQDALFAL